MPPDADNLTAPTDTPPADPTPIAPATGPVVGAGEVNQAPSPKPPKNRKKLGLVAIIVAILAVLIGGSAAAYYAVVLPNKPENVLKSSLQNLLEQHQVSEKGTLSIDIAGPTAADVALKNVTVTFTGGVDTDKNAFATQLDVSASGVKLPLEIRGIDQNLYFKIGDLSTIKSLASLSGPEAAQIVDTIGGKLSNQWIEIDSSLLKQANVDCATNLFNSLSKQDVDQITKLYGDNAFLTVKSKTADVIEGTATTRYELTVDQQKAGAFGAKLGSVAGLKKITDCTKTATKTSAGDKQVNQKDDLKNTSFNVWIDKSKKLRQLELKGTDQDTTLTLTVKFTDDKVNVTKPDGAKPLLQVLGDFGQLFGLGSGGLGQGTGANVSGVSQQCLQAIQDYANSGGTKPIPASCM